MRSGWYVYNAGLSKNKGDIIRFSFVAPSYMKRLIGVYVFSPELACYPPSSADVHVSVLINNEAQIPVCKTFSLGMNYSDENVLSEQLILLNVLLTKGERISGFIERLSLESRADPIQIKLHFKYERVED